MASPTPVAPKSSSFGTVSVVCAALTVLLPVAIMLSTVYDVKQHAAKHPESEAGVWIGLGGMMLASAVAGLCSLVGTLTGIVALVRDDPRRQRLAVGLAVNMLVLLFVVFFVFMCVVWG